MPYADLTKYFHHFTRSLFSNLNQSYGEYFLHANGDKESNASRSFDRRFMPKHNKLLIVWLVLWMIPSTQQIIFVAEIVCINRIPNNNNITLIIHCKLVTWARIAAPLCTCSCRFNPTILFYCYCNLSFSLSLSHLAHSNYLVILRIDDHQVLTQLFVKLSYARYLWCSKWLLNAPSWMPFPSLRLVTYEEWFSFDID